jgi:hypothetical protein
MVGQNAFLFLRQASDVAEMHILAPDNVHITSKTLTIKVY